MACTCTRGSYHDPGCVYYGNAAQEKKDEVEGSFWGDKCESHIKGESGGFRCIRLKHHDGKHEGAWCAPFVKKESGQTLLTVTVSWW